MKYIIYTNTSANRTKLTKIADDIHNGLSANIDGYAKKTKRYAEVQTSLDESKIMLQVDDNDVRNPLLYVSSKVNLDSEINREEWYNDEELI